MQVAVTFRHMEASDSLKEYVEDKLKKIERYLKNPVEIHVVMSTERHLHTANFDITAKQFSGHFNEKSDDMYASIDIALDKIEKAARRHKEKNQASKSSA